MRPARHGFSAALCLIILVLQLGCAKESITPSEFIRLAKHSTGPGQAVIEVDLSRAPFSGLAKPDILDSTTWESIFHVHAEAAHGVNWRELPPVQGTHRVKGNLLIFEPLFPLQAGINYHAVFEPAKANAVVATLRLEAHRAKWETIVSQVYPTANALPENLLKFYLHFSAPMSQGRAYRHIHLLNAQDEIIDLPFLEVDEELWNPDGTRLTVLFDPGRIKSGLLPHEQEGPVLQVNQAYTLRIDAAWPDAKGAPLKGSFTKHFIATDPDVEMPSPARWEITAPKASSLGPLTLLFPEPLDQALLQRLVWVETTGQHAVEGRINIGDSERRWAFTPDRPWTAGSYRIVIGTALEDLAGNSVARPFEVDRIQHPDDVFLPEHVRLKFSIGE
ncbi:MAG: Ig-like domain-containing protein [Verrucomicrobiota bacterium]|nr:Ig-like domain-containing protein [Verrucomicrobiota bacterium]